MRVVLVLIYTKMTRAHRGSCENPYDHDILTSTYRKTVELPTGFNELDYFNATELDEDSIDVSIDDPRLDQYKVINFEGGCQDCCSEAWLKKAFLTTQNSYLS